MTDFDPLDVIRLAVDLIASGEVEPNAAITAAEDRLAAAGVGFRDRIGTDAIDWEMDRYGGVECIVPDERVRRLRKFIALRGGRP